MNKFMTKIVGAALGLTMAIGVGVAVSSNREAVPVFADATSGTVKYAQTSTTAASISTGVAPSGTSVTFNNTYTNNKEQLTSGNSMTWTFKGYSGKIISNFKADLKNNASKGSAGITLTNNGSGVSLEYSTATGIGSTYTLKTLKSASFVASGDLVLTISATANSAYCDYVQFDWADQVSVTGVSLNKSSTTIDVGGSEQLTATIIPDNATNQNVTWSASGDSDITVSSTGLVSVANTATVGDSSTITVTTTDGGYTATCTITATANVPVTGVSLNKNETSIMEGETETLTATVAPSGASNKNVTWSSSNAEVATVDDGVVTAVSAGSATITVTTEDGSKTATCDVTVTAYAGKTYTKVTSAPKDWRGTYLLVYERSETSADVFDSRMATFDVTEKTLSGTISSNTITGTKEIDAAAVKIERGVVSDTSYYFIKCANGNYLKSGSKTINHQSEKEASLAASFDDVALKVGTYYLRFNASSGQDRFRFGASDYCNATVLYKMDYSSSSSELTTYVSSFATKTGSVCKTDNSTNVSDLNTQWSSLAASFASLSVDAQAVLANTTYTHNGETKDTLADIVDRYDWIVAHHLANLTAGEFMNRSEAETLVEYARINIGSLVNLSKDSSATLIIIVVSLISLTAICGYAMIRRKKEN